MPILIPEINDLSVVENHSYAEYEIIKEIKKLDPIKTKDWIIYYSFYFKGGKRSLGFVNNEIDFLFLIPNGGIFTFEIKGGRIQNTEYGLKSIDRNGIAHDIDPYNQSKNNFYALEDALKEQHPSGIGSKGLRLGNFKSGSLVGFPDIDVVPDVGPMSTRKDTFVRGMNLHSFIMENVNFYLEKKDNKKIPSIDDIEDIRKQLTGENYIYTLNKHNYIESVNLKLNDLTEEQKTIFQGLLQNDRCLINGGPGTGKTVLCEFLYKELIKQKNSVVYFSFNRLISERLQNDLSLEGGECYPILDYIQSEYERLTNKKVEISNYEEKKNFLLKNISALINDSLLSKTYDCVIIDEAQDIDDNPDMIDFIDLILNRGLKNGKCYFFFDNNQSIFGKKRDKKIFDNECFGFGENGYRYAKFELNRNCRNSNDVRTILTNISRNNDKDLSKSLIANSDNIFKCISKDRSGVLEIKNTIDALNHEGVKNKQITLLFDCNNYAHKNYIVEELMKIYGKSFDKYTFGNTNKLTYETVSRFKGLENDVVIYVNDNPLAKKESHFVAISRARVFAYIFKVR